MELALTFAVLVAGLMTCMLCGVGLYWAFLAVLALYFALARRRGFSARGLLKMAWSKIPNTLIVLRVIFFIGLLTGLWRSGGTIAFFIYYGLQLIRPKLFLLVAFLLTAVLAYALGSSFGVAGTVGVILMAMARSGGVNETVAAGVLLSAIYFGDRGAPTSSCASLVAALTETELYDNVRRMHKTAALPYALTLGFYIVLSVRNPIVSVDETLLSALREGFVLSPWALVPALLMLVLPLFKVPIRRAMAISAALAFVLTLTVQGMPLGETLRVCLLGYEASDGLLSSAVSGGGLISMKTPFLMLPLASLFFGMLEGTGALTRVQRLLGRAAERWGSFPTMCLLSLACSMALCNQTIVVMVSHQLISAVYAARGAQHEELAMDIANSAVTIAGLVPWCIACSVPLGMMGVGTAALPYACLLYLIPLCYFFTRSRFFPKRGKVS